MNSPAIQPQPETLAPRTVTVSEELEASGPVTIPWWKYEFADFGCSQGGSLAHCLKRFDARSGIGIDIDPDKVEKTRAAGFDAALADLHQLDGTKSVRFVSMMQFLEHLPSLTEVERVIGKAASLATDFLYIHHPSFEDEHYLESNGLRLYYHHWTGHITHVLRNEFFEMFERLGLLQYHVRPLLPIASRDHEAVLPLSAPVNQHQ
ncbi:MAG: class I SAM-dependent methyltransferase, partial [Myxococcota bacterium]